MCDYPVQLFVPRGTVQLFFFSVSWLGVDVLEHFFFIPFSHTPMSSRTPHSGNDKSHREPLKEPPTVETSSYAYIKHICSAAYDPKKNPPSDTPPSGANKESIWHTIKNRDHLNRMFPKEVARFKQEAIIDAKKNRMRRRQRKRDNEAQTDKSAMLPESGGVIANAAVQHGAIARRFTDQP